ncbi:hypothetical protein Efla_001030 [Eimeria flavescens]
MLSRPIARRLAASEVPRPPLEADETAPRRLSLPIPKRRSPPSRATPVILSPLNNPGVYLHQQQQQQQQQQTALLGVQQARKYFCVASPSHSSDASTVDDCEEAPPPQWQQAGGPPCCLPPDITAVYALQRLIGTGSQSFVYECRWIGDAAAAATPAAAAAGGAAAAAAAAPEGPLCVKHIVGDCSLEALQAACSLCHPNVVKHFAAQRDWRGLWVVMEYVGGPDLAAFLQAEGPLDESTSKAVFRQLVGALQHIHAHRIVHQDVKLENLVVRRQTAASRCSNAQPARAADTLHRLSPREAAAGGPNGAADIQVVLVDFGSAEVEPNQHHLAKSEASPAGTAMYMAPEAFSESPAGSKSDIWSAGILLCLLLAGRSPFEGHSIMSTLGAQHPPATNSSSSDSSSISSSSSSSSRCRMTPAIPAPPRCPFEDPEDTHCGEDRQRPLKLRSHKEGHHDQHNTPPSQQTLQQQQQQQQVEEDEATPTIISSPKSEAVRWAPSPASDGALLPPAAAAPTPQSSGTASGTPAASAATGPEVVRERLLAALQQAEWQPVSAAAKELVLEMLTVDAAARPSATKVLQSRWLQQSP